MANRTSNDLQNITQKTKDRVTRTSLKTNNDLQNITQKTKDRVTRTPLKTNNDLQNITHKAKDRVTRTPLKTEGELMCSRRVGSSCTKLPNISKSIRRGSCGPSQQSWGATCLPFSGSPSTMKKWAISEHRGLWWEWPNNTGDYCIMN